MRTNLSYLFGRADCADPMRGDTGDDGKCSGYGQSSSGRSDPLCLYAGCQPAFFALAYLTAQLSRPLERRFAQLVAVIVFVLGALSISGVQRCWGDLCGPLAL